MKAWYRGGGESLAKASGEGGGGINEMKSAWQSSETSAA